MTRPIYVFTEDDARNGKSGIIIVQVNNPVDAYDNGYELQFSGDDRADSLDCAEKMRQEYATAIADWMIAASVRDFAKRMAEWLLADDEVSRDPVTRRDAQTIVDFILAQGGAS